MSKFTRDDFHEFLKSSFEARQLRSEIAPSLFRLDLHLESDYPFFFDSQPLPTQVANVHKKTVKSSWFRLLSRKEQETTRTLLDLLVEFARRCARSSREQERRQEELAQEEFLVPPEDSQEERDLAYLLKSSHDATAQPRVDVPQAPHMQRLNFNAPGDLTNTTPVRFLLQGVAVELDETVSGDERWQSLLEKIVNHLIQTNGNAAPLEDYAEKNPGLFELGDRSMTIEGARAFSLMYCGDLFLKTGYPPGGIVERVKGALCAYGFDPEVNAKIEFVPTDKLREYEAWREEQARPEEERPKQSESTTSQSHDDSGADESADPASESTEFDLKPYQTWLRKKQFYEVLSARHEATRIRKLASFLQRHDYSLDDLYSLNVRQMTRLLNRLVKDAKFKAFNKREKGNIKKAFRQFLAYAQAVKDGQVRPPVTRPTPAVDSSADDNSKQSGTTVQSTARKCYVDFTNPLAATGGKPICVLLFGQEFLVANWRDVYLNVIEQVWRHSGLSAGEFVALLKDDLKFKPATGQEEQPTWESYASTLGNAYRIKTHGSTVDLLRRIRMLLKATRTPRSQALIEYAPSGTNVPTSRNAKKVRIKPAPGNKLLDLTDLSEATNGKPVRVVVFGKEFPVENWREVYLYAFEELYRRSGKSPKEFVATLRNAQDFIPVDQPEEKRDWADYELVLDGAYFMSKHGSVVGLLQRLRSRLKDTGTPRSQVVIEYAPGMRKRGGQRPNGDGTSKPEPKLRPTFSQELRQRAEEILLSRFPNGYRADVIGEGQFLEEYKNLFHEDLPEEIAPTKLVKAVAHYHDEQFYYRFSDRALQTLRELVNAAFERGNHVISPNAFYEAEEELLNSLNLTSATLTREALRNATPQLQYVQRAFLPTDCDVTPREQLLRDVLGVIGEEFSYSLAELKTQLNYSDPTKLSVTLRRSNLFVIEADKTLYPVAKLHIDPGDLKATRAAIEEKLQKYGVAAKDDIVVEHSGGVNGIESALAMREALFKQALTQDYVLSKDRIFRLGDAPVKSSGSHRLRLLREYCRSHATVELSELEELEQKRCNSVKRSFFVACSEMIRVDQTRFVAPEEFHVNVESVDKAIAPFLNPGVIPLKDVTSFTCFYDFVPNCPWNYYLLAGYCTHKSARFSFMGYHFKDSVIGAIYAKGRAFKSYNEILAAIAFEKNAPTSTKELLDFLFENGLIARRNYHVDEVINLVQSLRFKTGN